MKAENTALINAYIDMIQNQRRYSIHTIVNYKKSLEDWLEWLKNNEFFKGNIALVDKKLAKNYAVYLLGKYSRVTLKNKVAAISSFYKYLICVKSSLDNPFAGVPIPKADKNLPVFLTEHQVPNLLNAPEIFLSKGLIDDYTAVRDKAILEVLYGSGFRISELCSLKWSMLDMNNGYARIVGKGNKERFCPFTKASLNLLQLWRKNYSAHKGENDYVFAMPNGTPLYARLVQRNLKKYLLVANLPSNITPHKLRHSYATHLVNDGMDLRTLQELLGHSSLSTTQIYTHIGLKKIKQEYKLAHPHS